MDRFCTSCGRAAAPPASFCSACGARQTPGIWDETDEAADLDLDEASDGWRPSQIAAMAFAVIVFLGVIALSNQPEETSITDTKSAAQQATVEASQPRPEINEREARRHDKAIFTKVTEVFGAHENSGFCAPRYAASWCRDLSAMTVESGIVKIPTDVYPDSDIGFLELDTICGAINAELMGDPGYRGVEVYTSEGNLLCSGSYDAASDTYDYYLPYRD